MTKTPRQSVPTVTTPVTPALANVFYAEIANDTDSAISCGVYDGGGMAIIPYQPINARGLLVYQSAPGSPSKGLCWKASQTGLCGWFFGE